MDNPLEEKKQIEKDMSIIYQFIIKSANEDRQYFSLFNEYLFHNHSIWFDETIIKMKEVIDNSFKNINISDIDNGK